MKTLQMIFTAGSTTGTLSLREPKDGLTLAAVQAVAQKIAADGVFADANGQYSEFVKAQMIERTVTELA